MQAARRCCAVSQDHANGDKHPSLVVEPGCGNQTGRMICGCYCPSCRLHNQPGQVMEAFEVYCRLANITKREAVQKLQAGMSVPQPAPRPTPPPAAPLVAEQLLTLDLSRCRVRIHREKNMTTVAPID